MQVVDQHAADERVRLEHLQREVSFTSPQWSAVWLRACCRSGPHDHRLPLGERGIDPETRKHATKQWTPGLLDAVVRSS